MVEKRTKPLRIGLDVDGVLCDFGTGVIKRAQAMGLHEGFPTCREEVTCWDMGPNFSQIMKDAWLDSNFWLSLDPLRDSNLPFEPECYITSRPVATVVTAMWLAKHGFPAADVICVPKPEDKLQHIIDYDLDLFVDDLFSTVRMIREAGREAVLYKAPYHVGHKEECEGLPVIERLEDICIN